VLPPDPEMPSLFQIVLSWLPILLLIGLAYLSVRSLQSNGNRAFGLGRSRVKATGEKDIKVTFADVAGLEEAKEEIKKIREEGGRVTETWKYVDGEFAGRFADGGVMDEPYITFYELQDKLKAQGHKFNNEDEFVVLANKLGYTWDEDADQWFKYAKGGEVFEVGKFYKAKDGQNCRYLGSNHFMGSRQQYKKLDVDDFYSKGGKMASGGVMKYEGSTEEEDFKEAEEYIGKDVWETLSEEDKMNATQYLKAKGVIGYAGQEEELADFMASQYSKGGSLYRGMRPSPSISATAYPRGFKMIGNDGNMWEIALDSRGVHRWTKSSSASRNDRMEQKAKIREAIELLESMRDDIDVDDEIATLKKLQ
jgi:hypothetical protein